MGGIYKLVQADMITSPSSARSTISFGIRISIIPKIVSRLHGFLQISFKKLRLPLLAQAILARSRYGKLDFIHPNDQEKPHHGESTFEYNETTQRKRPTGLFSVFSFPCELKIEFLVTIFISDFFFFVQNSLNYWYFFFLHNKFGKRTMRSIIVPLCNNLWP